MYWLTENAFQPMMWGLLTVFAAGAFGFVLRKRILIVISLVVLAITIGLVVTEQLIVTDSEQLVAEVNSVAAAITRNDQAAVLACISPKNENLINEIKNKMPKIDFKSVSVNGLTPPEIDMESIPPTAQLRFNSRVSADATRFSQIGASGTAMVRVTLYYEKTIGGEWRIVDYDHNRIRPNDFFGGSEK